MSTLTTETTAAHSNDADTESSSPAERSHLASGPGGRQWITEVHDERTLTELLDARNELSATLIRNHHCIEGFEACIADYRGRNGVIRESLIELDRLIATKDIRDLRKGLRAVEPLRMEMVKWCPAGKHMVSGLVPDGGVEVCGECLEGKG